MKNITEVKALLSEHYPNRTSKTPVYLHRLETDEVVRGNVGADGTVLNTNMEKIGVWAEFTIVPAPEKPKKPITTITVDNPRVSEALDFERAGGVVATVSHDSGTLYASGKVGYALLSEKEDGFVSDTYKVRGDDIIAFGSYAKREASEPTPEPSNSIEPAETEISPVLDWFKTKDASRYKRHDERVREVSEKAVAIDDKKHRYSIESGKVYRYLALKSGGYAKQLFGNAAFAPEFVSEALNS